MSYIPSVPVASNTSPLPCLPATDAVSPWSRGAAFVSCSTHTQRSNDCSTLEFEKDTGGRCARSSGAWRVWRYHGAHLLSSLNPPTRRQVLSLDTSSLQGPPTETPNSSTNILEGSLANTIALSIFPPAFTPTGAPPRVTSTSQGAPSRSDSLTPPASPGGGQSTFNSATGIGVSPTQSNPPLEPTLGPNPASFEPRTSVSQPGGSQLSPSPPESTSLSISIITRQAPQPSSIPSTAGRQVTTLQSIFTTVFPSIGSINVTMSETTNTLTDILGSLSTVFTDTLIFTLTSDSTSIFTTSLPEASDSTPTIGTPTSTSITFDGIPTSSEIDSTTTTHDAVITTTSTFSLSVAPPIPLLNSSTIYLSIPHTSSSISVSTRSEHSVNSPRGSTTVTSTTLVQTGVLSTDRTRSDGGFERNTGAIIGIALAGTFALIISVIITFFTCRRYKRRGSVVSDSRENFLGHPTDPAWRPPLEADDEFDPFHGFRQVSASPERLYADAAAAITAGPGYDNLAHLHSRGGGGGGGDGEGHGVNGGLSSGASTESAAMYPVQTHSYGGGDSYAYFPGFSRNTTGTSVLPGTRPSSAGTTTGTGPGRERAKSMDRMTTHSLDPLPGYGQRPNESVGSGGPGLVQTQFHNHYQIMNISDPFHDSHALPPVMGSGSASGHQSIHGGNSKSTSSLYLGSSSQGHALSTSVKSHTAVPASSSGHGVRVSGRSASASPVDRRQVPPSSYMFPQGGPDSDSGSGSDRSGVRGLFGMLKTKGKGKGQEKRRSLRLDGVAGTRESGESAGSKRSMTWSHSHSQYTSAGHGTARHASLHGHGPPSSLLNPPMPVLILPPQDDVLPPEPIPIIQYPDLPGPSGVGYAYSTPEELADYHPLTNATLGPNVPYIDLWPPPALPSSPSPAPSIDGSSMVEGLLNPRILPGGISAEQRLSAIRGLWSSEDGGESVMSLRDNIDYSRPISGVAYSKMRSTTTFGTGGIEEGERVGSLRASGSTVGPEVGELDRSQDGGPVGPITQDHRTAAEDS